MTSTTTRAPEHLLRCDNADAGNPAARSTTLNATPVATDLREQESLVMRRSVEAPTTVSNTSASPGSGDSDAADRTGSIGNLERSSWPFNPDDVSPLQWWRTMPADHLGDEQHLLLRTTMQNIGITEGHEWIAGLQDDAPTSVAIALGALPITEITLDIDLAMSALMASALGGNAGSTVVLSHILCLAPLDHPFARELSISWLALNLRRALEVKANAIARRHETANRYAIDHRAAFYAGDFS